jgi:uncharacterized protein YcbK (DUF882 family)
MRLSVITIFMFIILTITCSGQDSFDGKLSLYNIHTKETLNINYLETDRTIDQGAYKKLQWFFRSRLDNKVNDIDINLIELIDRIQDHFGKDRVVEVISGYRSSALNDILKSHSKGGVAGHSCHLLGKAVDLRVRGIPSSKTFQLAMSLKKGGAAYYSDLDFVHIDTGRPRTW